MIVVVTANPQTGQIQIQAEGAGTTPDSVVQVLVGAAQMARQQAKEQAKPRLIVPPNPLLPEHNGGAPK